MIKTRRFYLGAALLVPLFFFSCTPQEQLEPEDEVISPETGDPGSSEGLVKMEFVGTQADDDGSRTYISGSKVLWKGSDKIAVIDDAAPYVHEFDNTAEDGGERCRFIGEAKAGESTWTVVYPAEAFSYPESDKADLVIPATQRAVEGSFADGSYFTFCRTSSKNVTMIPLLSMLKIHIAYENLTQVRIMANSSPSFDGTVRALAGTFRFNYALPPENEDYGRLNYKSGASYITLLPPGECDTFPAADYYIPVAPLGDTDAVYGGSNNSAVQNLRLEFTRADNQVASRSLKEASIVFKRGKYFDLGTVDEGLSWEYFDIAFGEVTDIDTKTQEYRWPFVSWTDDNWTTTKTVSEPITGGITLGAQKVLQFKLKDSGHIVKAYNSVYDENVRIAGGAKALFIGSKTGDYIEFPAIQNRALLRVEVQYDSLSTHTATSGEGGSGEVVGFSYCKLRTANQCPHITTTSDVNVAYTMSRDEKGFHHNYNLFNTEIGTAYRYRLEFNGENWVGPRIQRIRLYYSKEAGIQTLTLPTLSASGYSTSLRNSHLTVSLTAASAELVNETAYDVGIVLKDVRAVDGTYGKDSVIFLNNSTPVRDGLTLTWEQDFRLPGGKDDTLNEEQQFYPFVRVRGDATNPVTGMTESSSGSNWVKGSLTTISRPTYTWTIDLKENYLYASDTSVDLAASVQVHSDITQNYDVGFIYKLASDPDDYTHWNCTYVDQNGVGKSTDEPTPLNPIQGYELADGDTKAVSATITGLEAGETYVYKPVIIQHAACYYGKGGAPSSEAYMFEYLLFEDGYTHSNERRVTISGPVVAVGSKVDRVPSGHYTAATTGYVNESDINVSHVKCSTNFVTGYLYGTSAHPTAGIRTRNSSVFPYADGEGDAIVYATNHLNASDKLIGLTDSDGATCYYRPYFAFADGTVKYPLASDYTFTCPAVSISATDYLWQGYNSADIMETATLSVGTECKVEMAYSTDDGTHWSSTSSDLSAGEHTFSTVTVTEGGQTVKVRARRSGSSAAWQTADVVLAHPISSVTTYSSSFYPSRTMATVAGSFTTLKVASNDLVEYGFCYTESNGTSHHEEARASDAAQAYYTINISDGVGDAYDRGHRLLGYFFARLYGSSSIPTAKNAELYSSKSGGQMMTHSWASNLGYAKRLYVCFNELPVYESRSATNPFLPHAAEDSDYIDALSVTYGNLCQEKKALLTGGQSLEFHMTSSSSVASKNATISGACCNNGDGRMRVYAGTVDDYILLPALDDYKIARLVTWFWGGRGSDLWTEEEARGNVYIFLTTDEDYSAGDMKPSRVLPSYQTGTSFPADVQNWTTSLNEENFPYDTYSGKPLRLHFAGQSVSIGDYSHYPTTPPDRTEVRCTGFWIDYAGAPTP